MPLQALSLSGLLSTATVPVILRRRTQKQNTNNLIRYAVDSLILLIQSIIATYAGYEFRPSLANGLTIAAYTGMLIGALFWGLGADVIGRKHAFNYSLLISSIFTIVAGASPN
jgi:MFS family permease